MSPRASGTVLPCSMASSSASSSMFLLTSSMNRINTRARRWGFHAAQSLCASTAEATAASTSDDEAIGTFACTSPVLGLKTSAVRLDWPRVRFPSIKCGICVVMTVLTLIAGGLHPDYLHILVTPGRGWQANVHDRRWIPGVRTRALGEIYSERSSSTWPLSAETTCTEAISPTGVEMLPVAVAVWPGFATQVANRVWLPSRPTATIASVSWSELTGARQTQFIEMNVPHCWLLS